MPADSEPRYGGAEPNTSWTPRTTADKEAIREQVGRILASALFKNSRRFPVFIRYTVEHAMSSTEPLKERIIGHEVFGRDPNYDTAQDPIVRMTAGEVRKRLTQYYQAPERGTETIVSYQAGSYIPEFFQPVQPLAHVASTTPSSATAAPIESRSALLRWGLVTAAVAAVALAALWLFIRGNDRLAWAGNSAEASALTRFWAPIATHPDPVLICIGEPARAPRTPDVSEGQDRPDDQTIAEFLQTNSVRYTDSVTLALLAGELRARGTTFRVRRPAATAFEDLRDGPVILIGGFNNPWTIKLSEGLRFTLATDAHGPYVRDRDRPDGREWQPNVSGRLIRNMDRTYGLITRAKDPTTGQSVLAVSGLALGTRAAGECLVDATCLQSAEQLAGDLSRENIQIVVSAAVVHEDSGAPRVLAVHAW